MENPEKKTTQHENLVKNLIDKNLESTISLLKSLDVVESKNIEVGNSALMFRFNIDAKTDTHEKAVKEHLNSTIDFLKKLDVVESSNIELGNSVLMFRFRK